MLAPEKGRFRKNYKEFRLSSGRRTLLKLFSTEKSWMAVPEEQTFYAASLRMCERM